MKGRDLTETEEWFRTKLYETINYGVAAITIIGGWLISDDGIISIYHAEDAEKQEAAFVLAVFLPLAWLAWFLVLKRLHARLPAHPTIVRSTNLHLLTTGALLVLIVMWCVAADVISAPAQFARPKTHAEPSSRGPS